VQFDFENDDRLMVKIEIERRCKKERYKKEKKTNKREQEMTKEKKN